MKKDKKNGWWYNFNRNPNEKILKRADDNIGFKKFPKLCPRCKKTWEKKCNDMRNPYHYYEKGTLPTYKMVRERCPKCKENIGKDK